MGKKVKELKKGDFFTLRPIAEPKESQVWIRGEYVAADKRYECTRFDDFCAFCYLPGDKEVFTDFTF